MKGSTNFNSVIFVDATMGKNSGNKPHGEAGGPTRDFAGRVKMKGGYDLITKYAKERDFESESEFARFLHEVEPTRSVDGWRGAILRWKRNKGGQITYTVWNGGKKTAGDSLYQSRNTPKHLKEKYAIDLPETSSKYYDKENDMYLTFIPNANQIVHIEGDQHRQMRIDYSDAGARLTVEQMSIKWSFPILWMRDYIKAYGWKHPMSPHTDEEIIEKDEDELVFDYLEAKRTAVQERSKQAYFANSMKKANKWDNFEQEILNEFREHLRKDYLPEKKKDFIDLGKARPYAVVISPTDLHFGSGAWIDETGNHYDTEEARGRLISRTHNLINRLPGNPEKLIIATGSDWFHVDNYQGATTKLTPQDMSVSPTQIFMDGCALAREHIEMLRGVAPIEIVFARGNHDRQMSLCLMLYLHAVYEEIEDVTVDLNPQLRQYVKWEINLLGFTHGDGVSGLDLPALMASEQWESWGECQHKVWFHGHLHHQKLLEKGGAIVVQLPSLAGNDRWHYRKGHVLSRPGLMAHLIDAELGLIGNLFAPVE